MNAAAKTIDLTPTTGDAPATPNSIAKLPVGDDPFVSMVERIVMDPAVPIDRLERVLAMKERMEDRARQDEDRQARKAYFDAMSKCQAELPIVTRNKENDHTKSRYADLAAIEKQAMPIIHKHGFSTSFWPDGYNEKGEQRVKWRISHAGGHSESDVAEIPVDKAGSQGKVNKTDTQAFGSTASYGRRYLLLMLFNISTGDDNDGNRVAGPINEAQLAELNEFIEKHEAEPSKILAKMKVATLEEIPAKEFPRLMVSLRAWADQQKAPAT